MQSGQATDPSVHDAAQILLDEFSSLESITPQRALSRYLQSREGEITDQTQSEYKRKLELFIDYCEKIGLENLNELDGRNIDGFVNWRRTRSTGECLSTKTMRDDLYLLRSFLQYLVKIDAVPTGTAQTVDIPSLDSGEGIRDVELGLDHLNDILKYLSTYKYASREHVLFAIVTECGRRLGGVHSLDVDDVFLDCDEPYLHFVHRDDGETRLKNGENGEEEVNISSELAELLDDYISNQRIEISTNDRTPLVTTSHGRIAKATIRSYFYQWTRPCKIGNDCPEGRSEDDCDAACSKDNAPQCPASEAPHAARHGYLTEMLRQGVPPEVISDRCDITEEVLREVYDERSTEEKRKNRRSLLEERGVIDR